MRGAWLRNWILKQMSRYMPLEEFRKRFKVVDPHDLAARDITKYYDPFVERGDELSIGHT